MKKYVFIIYQLFVVWLLQACGSHPVDVRAASDSLVIYPAYQEVTIPVNVAPLNFMVRNKDVESVYVTVEGKSGKLVVNKSGNKVLFDLEDWKQFLQQEKGHKLHVTVQLLTPQGWFAYPGFDWTVMPEEIDAYLTYRLIEPGYEVWHELQLRERCVENFKERVIADNHLLGEKCMNCHIHGNNSGKLSLFHLRGEGGGTILNRNGKLRKLNLKKKDMASGAVYGDFHPSGRYGVFSTNIIIPSFHAQGNRRLEVYDSESDLVIADFDRNMLISSPLVADAKTLETFPTFSSDGKSVFYCSAPLKSQPDSVRYVKYSLCRIGFDSLHGQWGEQVDTLWNARTMNGSVCFPKLSPDGRFILYTVASYGTFPIWHRETDLQLMDLKTGRIDSLKAVNSNRSETYHCWSSNGHWIAFASKRGDGQYGRVYFAYVYSDGRVGKPFVLPQADPENDDLNLKSYNIPDLATSSVPFDANSIERIEKDVDAECFN